MPSKSSDKQKIILQAASKVFRPQVYTGSLCAREYSLGKRGRLSIDLFFVVQNLLLKKEEILAKYI